MREVLDSSRPRLAPGCRWSGQTENRSLLFPEGILRLDKTADEILALCDGQRTIREIVDQLKVAYGASDPATIESDTITFLGKLHTKRLVDFR